MSHLLAAACITLTVWAQQKYPLENYSFDFSAGHRPISWIAFGNAVEMRNKVKLNPAVENKWGGLVFDGIIN